MYIQITTKCNMKCAHCCFNCTERGTNMSIATFEAACKLAKEHGHNIFIGGGEPTLHPKFWAMLGMAMTYCTEDKVGIITNGSMTETSLRLAELARNGLIFCGLSQDEYHSFIDPEVIQAFHSGLSYRSATDSREIRNVGENVKAMGRAKTNQISDEPDCCCADLFVSPRGKLYACGCKKTSLGTVHDPNFDNYDIYEHDCRGVA